MVGIYSPDPKKIAENRRDTPSIVGCMHCYNSVVGMHFNCKRGLARVFVLSIYMLLFPEELDVHHSPAVFEKYKCVFFVVRPTVFVFFRDTEAVSLVPPVSKL